MKKSFILLTAVFLLNAPVAKSLQPSMFLNDSESFRIAKSVKLGYGDSSRSPSKGTGTKTSDFKTCSSDNNCPTTQECVNGNCKDLCSPNPCPEQKPDCEAKDHSYTCTCTETSCGEGKECVNGKCESCTVGTKCNCEGEKVLGTNGTCVCPSGLSCSAGQYVGDDCSCTSCPENDTRENKCGCPGNTVPDGNGSCYCKTTKSCGEGYSFDSSNTCECVACTDNDSCDNPCSAGTIPTPDGCKAYACAVDEDCAEGNRCENGGTESAQCVPCGKNEQCRCPEGQLSDGTGKCVSVTCKTGLVCSKDITKQCCDAGMQCVNPDTVESYCAACEVDTQCTCPDGYLVNKEGKCVKPACTKNSDCPNGKYCENPGKSNAECVPCNEGEPCPTCPSGYVADGKGGCKLGCTFDTASVCVSGTANCKTCTQSGGCYTCTDCKNGYYPDNGTCISCKQKFGDNCEKCTPNKCTTCEDGYEPDPYTGKCKAKACPDGYSTTETCYSHEKQETNGYSGGKACIKCVFKTCAEMGFVENRASCGSEFDYIKNEYTLGAGSTRCYSCQKCPTGYTGYGKLSACEAGKKKESMQDNAACVRCVNCNAGESCGCPAGQVADGKGSCAENCPDGYSTSVTSCSGNEKLETNGSSGGKACGKCVSKETTCAEQGYKTSCPQGYTPLKRTTGSDGTCYECKCNNGYETTTPVNGYYCVPCGMKYGPCSKCTATACTLCTSPYSINPSCKDGQYKSYATTTTNCAMCANCPTGCTKCTDANTCTACASGYTLKNGKCEKVNCTYTSKAQCMSSEHTTGCTQDGNGCWNRSGECQSGYWLGHISRDTVEHWGCTKCPSAASTCKGNTLTCKSGYALMGGGGCYECSKNCGTCKEVGPDSCYTCASGYYTFNHRSESTPGYCCKGKHTSDITQCVYN